MTLYADERLIRRLLFESGISRYEISKNTGIGQNTLSMIYLGKTAIEKLQFRTAAALTAYAASVLLIPGQGPNQTKKSSDGDKKRELTNHG